MKRKIVLILLLLIFGTLVVVNLGKISTLIERWSKFSFCDETVYYKMGSIDPRFNISESKLKEISYDGAQVWNEQYDEKLFAFDPTADLTISLVFDERQSLLSTLNEQSTEVDTEKENLESELAKFEQQKVELDRKIQDLNNEIAQWNAKGGAPKPVYDAILQQQQALNREITRINNLADSLNRTTEKINKNVEEVNQKVDSFNALLQAKPEQGLYKGSTNSIEIYIYHDDETLKLTIAHELGHALGLDHIETENALMSPKSTRDSKVTDEDIALLNNFCEEQDKIELIKNDLNYMIRSAYNNLLLIINN